MSHEIPDDVEQRMFIKPVEPMPNEVVGRLSREEIEEFSNEDLRKVMFAISKIVQVQSLQWQRFETFVWQSRQSEAKRIQSEDRRDKRYGWVVKTIVVALLSAIAMRIFKVL